MPILRTHDDSRRHTASIIGVEGMVDMIINWAKDKLEKKEIEKSGIKR